MFLAFMLSLQCIGIELYSRDWTLREHCLSLCMKVRFKRTVRNLVLEASESCLTVGANNMEADVLLNGQVGTIVAS